MSALDELVAKANKKYGEGMLIRGNQLKDLKLLRCTSGSLAIDLALGGGWPLNCWNEVIGQESSGKTAMTLKTIAANQARDRHWECLYIASEDFVWDWAQALGVDLKRTVVAQTRVMEEAYQLVVDALDDRAADCIVIDSYPALTPIVEDEKLMDEMSVGIGARLTNQFMRKSNKAGRRSLVAVDRPCLAILINQWRERIGVMRGDPRVTPGGKGKNFAAFTQVETARVEWIEAPGPTKVGISMKAKVIKNKTAPPQRTGQVDFYFAEHHPFHRGDYDTVQEVAVIALAHDIVERAGSIYRYGAESWKGKEPFYEAMRQDLDLQRKIDSEVRRVVLKQPAATKVSSTSAKRPAKVDTPVTTGRKLARAKQA